MRGVNVIPRTHADALLISKEHPFVSKWRSAFVGVGTKAKCTIDPDLWERPAAVRELQKTQWLDFVVPVDELMELALVMFFRYVVREVEIYNDVSNEDLTWKRESGDALHVLKLTANRLLKAGKTTASPGLKNVLSKLSLAISQERAAIQEHRESYWDHALLASRAARKRWFIDIEEMREIPPKELLEVGHIFTKVKFPRKLGRRSDLDRRFQIRTATIIRRYLLDASVETVSRLVVLCYLCGGLATVRDGTAYLHQDSARARPTGNRILTVGAVYQKLKDEPNLARRFIRGSCALSEPSDSGR